VLAALLRGRAWPPVSRYVVQGPSMEPAYRHGDRLLVNRLAYLRHPPRPGDVVVLRDPEHPERLLLKRVLAVEGESSRATVQVLGDNARQSRDSRTFGAVPSGLVVGRAWRKY
jgi:nickel-type superoxide dismutase maturation protease